MAVGSHCFAALSLNGELWQESYDFRINGASDIIYANGKYVVVGNKGFTNTSTNGSVWEQKLYAGNINWKGVAYADGKYVAVGSSGYITSSNDGVSWTTPKLITDESGNPITATLNSICIMP